MLKNLTYKVVVIDDDEDFYEDYTEIIQNKLNEAGYFLEHKRYEELSDLSDNDLSDVDLFLVDLKFGKEDKGQEFISKIRENYFTDILFYSSDAKAINAKKSSGGYQGVFFAVRDEYKSDIEKSINGLVDKLIKRSNSPIAARGIVLSCVAELDTLIKMKIVYLLQQLDPVQKKDIEGQCIELFRDSYKGIFSKAKIFFGCEFHNGIKPLHELKNSIKEFDIEQLSKNIYLTDSSKNLNILLKLYKKIKGEDEAYQTIKNLTELLDDRNILAHVQEELMENGDYRFKRPKNDEYLVLTTDKCKELRKAITSYAKKINTIV